MNLPILHRSPFTRTRWLPKPSWAHIPILKRLLRELRVVKRAQVAGLQGLPPPNATEPDETQRDIGQAVVSGVTLLLAALNDWAMRARALIEGRTPEALELGTWVERLRNVIAAKNIGVTQTAQRLVGALTGAQIALTLFVATREITRPPHYSRRRWPFWAKIGAVVALESAFNALAFARAVPDGLLGAFFYMIAISLANVVILGVVTGTLCVRALLLPSVAWRLIGGFGLVACTIGAVLFQWFVVTMRAQGAAMIDYYRTATSSMPRPEISYFDVLEQAQLSPSIAALAIVGLASWAYGSWKFAGGTGTPWDVIWGYASRDRAVGRAADAIQAEYESYSAIGEAQHRAMHRGIDPRVARETEQSREVKLIVDAIMLRREEVRDSTREWVVMGGTALLVYARNNSIARGPLTPPVSFNTVPAAGTFDDRINDLATVKSTTAAAFERIALNRAAVHAAEAEFVTIVSEGRSRFVQEVRLAHAEATGRAAQNVTQLLEGA